MNRLIATFMSLYLVMTLQSSEAIQEWPRTKTSIDVQTAKLLVNVPINAQTTIAGVKKYLEQKEGIPAGQQRICLVWRVPSLFYLGWGRNPDLHDEVNVYQLMSDYNTDKFELYLRPGRESKQS